MWWKLLLDFAIAQFRKQLLPRLTVLPGQYAFIEKAVDMAERTKDIYTDDDKDNKRQMQQLWAKEHEEVLVLSIRASASFAKADSTSKKKVLAILAEAIDDIMEDDGGSALRMVSST